MPDAMHDRGKFWTPAPHPSEKLDGGDWQARRVAGPGQTLLSGDLDAARAALAPGAGEVGLWGIAGDGAHLIRIARDRALLVTPAPLAAAPGWRGGFATTPCDDLYAIVEISGPGMPEVMSEATAADLTVGSPSAAVQFAGLPCLLCRTRPEVVRLYVESPFAAYIWTWLASITAGALAEGAIG